MVVVAAGLWSRALLRPIGIYLPQWHCEHFYIIAEVVPRLGRETPSFVVPEDLLYGREEVGGMMVGFFDENAKIIEDGALPEPFTFTLLPPDWDKIAPYFEQAAKIFPALSKPRDGKTVGACNCLAVAELRWEMLSRAPKPRSLTAMSAEVGSYWAIRR